MRNQVERGIYRDEDPKCSQVDIEMLDSLRATPIRTCKKMSVFEFLTIHDFCYFLLRCKKRYAATGAFLVPLRETQSAAKSNVACVVLRCPCGSRSYAYIFPKEETQDFVHIPQH